MNRILVVGNESDAQRQLARELDRAGFSIATLGYDAASRDGFDEHRPDVVVLNMTGPDGDLLGRSLLHRSDLARSLPVIAVIESERLERLDLTLGIADFAVAPLHEGEIRARVRHLLWRSASVDAEHMLRVQDLVMDLANYKVFVAGRTVDLTYKEYELLRFLAQNRDKVFTREALLSRVWGYDYYGGARTVDVHIRRLRSKLEDNEHSFIETVRNVGYRFRTEDAPG